MAVDVAVLGIAPAEVVDEEPIADGLAVDDAVVVVAGGKDGYVGRDGRPVGDNPRGGPPGAA